MGQVIAFPALASPYPDRAADLDRAECVLLVAVRSWVASYRIGEDPLPCLFPGLETAGAHDAAFSIDRLMEVVARSVTRPAEIHCPGCPQLSSDEKNLLHAASLAQAEESLLARRTLRTTLLSAQGAEFAIGPLEGLAELFTQARLFLSRRRLQAGLGPQAGHEPHAGQEPATGDGSPDARQSWSPPHTLH